MVAHQPQKAGQLSLAYYITFLNKLPLRNKLPLVGGIKMVKTKWTIDPAHSSIDFSVRHMMISRVIGTFQTFDASIEADPADLTTAKIQLTVDLSSIHTRNRDRDQHLISSDFFDIDKYPLLTFQTTNISKKGVHEYVVTGDVNLHGVTRQETFTVVFEGVAKDPISGAEKAGYSANGVIKRSNYGLTWNTPLETGGVLIGDDVKVTIHIEAAKRSINIKKQRVVGSPHRAFP